MSLAMHLNQHQRKRLHQIALVATFGGLLFGYDTGVINGALSSLKENMALTPTTEGLVMSVLLIGAAIGSVWGESSLTSLGVENIYSGSPLSSLSGRSAPPWLLTSPPFCWPDSSSVMR